MTKAAILIDGGFFLKRLPSLRLNIDVNDPRAVSVAITRLVNSHLEQLNRIACVADPRALLYRCFYYDAVPYLNKAHYPISRKAIDYAKTPQARFRLELFDQLKRTPNLAVRLGQVQRDGSGWTLSEHAQTDLLKGAREAKGLTDDDFQPTFRQKGVDMRIGIDIASLTLKRQIDTIILVAGDADFVPASKLARREGVKIILDPLWLNISAELSEHIDGLTSGLPRPR